MWCVQCCRLFLKVCARSRCRSFEHSITTKRVTYTRFCLINELLAQFLPQKININTSDIKICFPWSRKDIQGTANSKQLPNAWYFFNYNFYRIVIHDLSSTHWLWLLLLGQTTTTRYKSINITYMEVVLIIS